MRLMTRPALTPRTGLSSHRPTRVCFVIDRLGRAGTETQLLALIRHLDRSRVRPSLCLLNGGDRDSRSLVPEGCPTLDLQLDHLLRPKLLAAAWKLARFWRQQEVDVLQTYFLDSTYFAAPLARLCGVRRVVRVRNNAGYWLTPTHRWLGRAVGRLCDTTLTNSEDGRRALSDAERLPSRRIRVIENGVDLSRFEAMPPPDTSRSVVRVGAVANLRPVKNIDGLIRAAASVCQHDHRVQFEVAGEGELRPLLEEQVRRAGLGDRFRLIGSVADVPAFLATVDVAVLCSHSESMSNALLEYMAAGRAVVATDTGANACIARDGREGIIVPKGSDAALTAALWRLLREPALARDLGAAARARTTAHFSRTAMVRRFEEFYLSLMK